MSHNKHCKTGKGASKKACKPCHHKYVNAYHKKYKEHLKFMDEMASKRALFLTETR